METMSCAYCKKDGAVVRDHVVPRSRGGPDKAFNIVMACTICNAAKSDLCPSEWLGDQCPDFVKHIEDMVNKRLASDFSKRDRRRRGENQKLYAIHIRQQDGYVDYVGEVAHFNEFCHNTVTLDVIDAVAFCLSGIWVLGGRRVYVPLSETRFFTVMSECAQEVVRINSSLL